MYPMFFIDNLLSKDDCAEFIKMINQTAWRQLGCTCCDIKAQKYLPELTKKLWKKISTRMKKLDLGDKRIKLIGLSQYVIVTKNRQMMKSELANISTDYSKIGYTMIIFLNDVFDPLDRECKCGGVIFYDDAGKKIATVVPERAKGIIFDKHQKFVDAAVPHQMVKYSVQLDILSE